MKNKLQNKIKSMKGGITTNYSPEEAFYKFIDKSNIQILTSGGTGIIFTAEYIGDSIDCPYTTFRAFDLGNVVKKILIKLVLLNEDLYSKGMAENKEDFEWEINNKIFEQQNYNSFISEVNTQCDISLKTIEYLEPVCPVIVYAEILDNNIKCKELIQKFLEKSINNRSKHFLESINKQIDKENVNSNYIKKSVLGIIGMELADSNFKQLDNMFLNIYQFLQNNKYINKYVNVLNNTKNLSEEQEQDSKKNINMLVTNYLRGSKIEIYKNMARLDLIEIAIKTGMTQGDFHFGNILVDPNYKGYYDNFLLSQENKTIFEKLENDNNEYKGKTLIIDYGYANKISEGLHDEIINCYDNVISNIDNLNDRELIDNFNIMLNNIYTTEREDGASLLDYHSWYSWIIGKYFGGTYKLDDVLLSNSGITIHDINIIKDLIKFRKYAIENLLYKIKKENIPLILPLTEEEINKKVYSGIRKGGGKLNVQFINDIFKTIGYGLFSRDLLIKKINLIKNKNKINKEVVKPYKMIETNNYLKPISAGVGGKIKKTRKINRKIKKSKKNKKIKKKNDKKYK